MITDLIFLMPFATFAAGFYFGSRRQTKVHVVEPYADPNDFGRH